MTTLVVILLCALFIIGIPVGFALILAVIPYFATNGSVPMQVIIQRFIASTESVSLLAIPFFIAAGSIMTYSGITDVLMGIIVDKTKFKSGKCRPYFLIGAIPLAITAVLAFSLPSMVSNDKVLIIAMALISFNLVSTCYTIVNTPLSAILPSLSADPGERNVLVTFRMVMAAVGSFCVTFFALPLINNFGGKADRFSYAWAIGIFSIGAVVLLAFSFFNTREVIKPIKEEKIKIKDDLKAINGQYVLFVITMFIYLLGFAVKQAGVFYFYNYLSAISAISRRKMSFPSRRWSPR